jgi:excisionase family DNA binding protein
MYSVREAAAKLGVTDRHVRLLLATGEISGRKLGHDWVVLGLEYERKRKPKTKRGQTTDRGEAQKWEETWTEGGL